MASTEVLYSALIRSARTCIWSFVDKVMPSMYEAESKEKQALLILKM